MTVDPNTKSIQTHIYQEPKQGNVCCGDSYYVKETDDYFLCAVADGLGSGEQARAASVAVTDVAKGHHHLDVDEIISKCNKATRHTRGAAVAILKIDKKHNEFHYTNVGNIRFYLYSPEGKLTYPLPIQGFLSGKIQKFRTQTFPYDSGSKFLIHTDGLELKEIKSVFANSMNVDQLSTRLQAAIRSHNDDITYIAGHLPTA
ncbi:phosphoserine phosphatase [Priestia aryabhattai]|uniref:PP2C family serine/threonine-protein phosphatase n=1 Tax=Priestia TaxID=2800373 RepID=UPI00279A5727|nr:PP2C family serine/threonine-protein phosphatase [Priestia megaterium]WDC90921.1 PP2C family serine/threonine-protein phosphatase [Priestia megaterium]